MSGLAGPWKGEVLPLGGRPARAGPELRRLWLYRAATAVLPRSYRGKFLAVAFIGTHLPLLGLLIAFALDSGATWQGARPTIAIALGATLAGAALTLFALDHLLRPISMTAKALRDYATDRRLPALPIRYRDEAGRMMADAARSLARLDDALDALASQDRVTGLMNRRRLLALLGERLQRGERLALCAVALRDDARIASALGQAAADQLARLMAQRLGDALGHRAAARLEGGLYLCVLPAAGHLAGEAAPVTALLASLGAEVREGALRLVPELTAGVALAPEDAAAPEALLNAAIAALREAGGAGGQVAFFSPAAQMAARRRVLLERDLRQALVRGDGFALHFQPAIDTTTGAVIGAEALLRWTHHERGRMAPAAFVAVAEAAGLMGQVGDVVLDAACRQLALWREGPLGALRLAVNVSAREAHDPALVERVATAMRRHGVGPGRLEIDVTETAAMRDAPRARAVFQALRTLGVRVAMDDFGSGCSSLGQLKSLAFDRIKLDRSIIAGVDRSAAGQAVCAAVLELARGLGTEVLAEGVETPEEVARLQALGCHLFQGYHFARPMPADAFEGWVRRAGSG